MAALYELINAFMDFEFIFDEETGEVLNSNDLDELEISLDDKIKNCIYYYKNKKAEAKALQSEKMRLGERQKRAELQAEHMAHYIAACLRGEAWQSKDKTQQVVFRRSEEVDANPLLLPAEYLRQRAPEPDKLAIKKALKAGEEIKGAKLIVKDNLIVK